MRIVPTPSGSQNEPSPAAASHDLRPFAHEKPRCADSDRTRRGKERRSLQCHPGRKRDECSDVAAEARGRSDRGDDPPDRLAIEQGLSGSRDRLCRGRRLAQYQPPLDRRDCLGRKQLVFSRELGGGPTLCQLPYPHLASSLCRACEYRSGCECGRGPMALSAGSGEYAGDRQELKAVAHMSDMGSEAPT